MNFVIDSVFVMLVCFVLGALMAWLLAAAMYPTRTDLREQDDDAERHDDVGDSTALADEPGAVTERGARR